MNNSVTNRKYQMRRIGVTFAVMLEVYERLKLYTARGRNFAEFAGVADAMYRKLT
jgi:hypothetical protein